MDYSGSLSGQEGGRGQKSKLRPPAFKTEAWPWQASSSGSCMIHPVSSILVHFPARETEATRSLHGQVSAPNSPIAQGNPNPQAVLDRLAGKHQDQPPRSSQEHKISI